MPKIIGSSNSFETRMAEFNQAACCTDISKMPYELLKGGLSFSLEENKAKTNLSTGPSYYKLFALPEDGEVHKYALRSFIIEQEGTRPHAAIPIVIFLNEKLQITRKSDFQFIKYMDWSIRNDSNYYLYFKTLKDNKFNEKYVLIVTSNKSYGEKFVNNAGSYESFNTFMVAGQVYATTNTRNEPFRAVKSSPSGVFVIDEFSNYLDTPTNFSYSVYF